jgi:integrase
MSGERIFRRGRIWYGWVYAEGRRIQRSTRCTDRRAAETLVRQWERAAADPTHAATSRATLGDALALVIERADTLAETGRRATATASFYRAKVGHLARVLEGEAPYPLARLDAAAVDRYVDQRRREGAGESTIAKELGALRLALRLAKRVGVWSGDAAAVLPILAGSGYVPRTRWLTVDEVQRLLAELVPDRAARVAFLVGTGARWSESDRALRADVAGSVRLRGTKTTLAARVVPLVLPEQRELVEYALRHAEGDGALFAPWGNVRRDLASACERARIVACSPNDLRRTLAHWLRQRGAGADLVAPVLGHADDRMVQRVYGRLGGAELEAALRAATGCSAGVAASAVQVASSDSLDDTGAANRPGNRGSSVPRDGIEPPTRGFSILRRLWPTPRKDTSSTAERRGRVAPVQQRVRRTK